MASEPLAILIDADNASPRIITGLLAEVANYGTAHAAPQSQTSNLDKAALAMIANAVTAAADEDGRAHLGRVGSLLIKQAADFDPRNYGFPSLIDLAQASGILDIEREGDGNKVVMVRLKEAKA